MSFFKDFVAFSRQPISLANPVFHCYISKFVSFFVGFWLSIWIDILDFDKLWDGYLERGLYSFEPSMRRREAS